MLKILILIVAGIEGVIVLQYFWMGIQSKKANKGKQMISDELIERLKE